jgi:integrase
MAFVQKRGNRYRVVFQFGGKKYRKSLKSDNAAVAEAVVGGVKRTLLMLEQGLLHIPEGADVLAFVLSGGKDVKMPHANGDVDGVATLEDLKTQYIDAVSIGAMEENSLYTVKMHLRHFINSLGPNFRLQDLKLNHLQQHVTARAKGKGRHGRMLSAMTIRKEIASLRAAWNWGVQAELVTGQFPNKGLKFPKLDEKPPFQTWEEIDRRIAMGGLNEDQIADLWDCLYLQTSEISELLAYVKEHETMSWVYPLVATAAHTGARRSELLRIQLADLDFVGRTILIHEKKRSREKRTTRRVTITPFLNQVLQEWLRVHPGGPWLFSQNVLVVRSKTKRSAPTQVTRNESHDHFKRTLAVGKWKVLRGLHSLRHSFISCLAAANVDQRIIDELVGHQTPEQQKRYRHIFPSVKYEAVHRVFG